MRLTLRTLLAWLDDAPMSQAQRKELKEKVLQSESARKLLDHLKSVESNRQIAAPQLDGQGSKDANTTAEYLDGELDDALVAQFEKSCLESDSLLAEVAGCHSVLSAILRQDKVRISSGMRERAYKMGRVLVRAHELEKLADSTKDSSDSSVSHGVEEELFVDRETTNNGTFDLEPPGEEGQVKVSSFMDQMQQEENESIVTDGDKVAASNSPQMSLATKVAIGILAAVVLLGVGIGIGNFMQGDDGEKVQVANAFDNAEEDSTDSETDKSDAVQPLQKESSDTKSNDNQKSDSTDNDDNERNESKPQNNDENAVEKTAKNNEQSNPNPENSEGKTSNGQNAQSDSKQAPNGNGDRDEIVSNGSKQNWLNDANNKDEDKNKDSEPEAKSVNIEMPVSTAWPESGIAPGEQVAVNSGKQLLVRNAGGSWEMVGSSEPVKQGDALMAATGFQPSIKFATSNVNLVGPARVVAGPAGDEKQPGWLLVHSGTVLLTAANDAGDGIMLLLGNVKGKLLFTDKTTVVAISVTRPAALDAKQSFQENSLHVQLTAQNGRALWDDGKNPVTVDPANVVVYNEKVAGEKQPLTSAPSWLPGTPSKIDAAAAANLSAAVQAAKNADRGLESFLNDARIENRYLAARALASLGRFQGALQILDDRRNKTYWTRLLNDLRAEVSFNQSSGNQLAKHLQADTDQTLILKMVVGFSDKELEAGSDEDLVSGLASDRLMVRVLAIENLRRITGSTYLYRPEAQEKTRAKYIRKWRGQLELDRIRHKK